MSRRLLAVCLLGGGVALALARDPVAVIDACVRTLDPELDVGFQRISTRCPELAPALTASPWAPSLPPDWNRSGNALTAAGLTELRTLLTRRAPGGAARPALRVQHLAAVLTRLASSDAPQQGWWARLKSWLREVLTRRRPLETGWLRRLLPDASVPQGLLDGVVWISLAGVILIAGAIVTHELRVAGLVRNGRSRRAARATGPGPRGPTVQEVDAAALVQRPRLLLQLIAAQLVAQDRLPPARALTVRELTRAARLPQAADRARLESLGAACERLRFASGEPAPQALIDALAQGRALFAALQTSARPAASG